MRDATTLLPPRPDDQDTPRPVAARPARDRFRGVMVGLAIGDALGRPAEGRTPQTIRQRYGALTDFHPWRGWTAGPVGTITDDTQLSMCVARSIVARGHLDPDDLAARFVGWLPEGRGKGRACTEAVQHLTAGAPWTQAGVPSAGNGAAMRVAPVGLVHARRPGWRRHDAAVSAVITHADPTAVVSAIAQAAAVAHLLFQNPTHRLDVAGLLDVVTEAVGDLPDPVVPLRRPDSTPTSLLARLREVPSLLERDADDVFSYLYNGAFVVESLPSAWWCFLRHADDPERALVVAANGGHDADTVASMTGALAGAYQGASGFPDRWLDELEFREDLTALADGLWELA